MEPQEERNATITPHPETSRCMCLDCGRRNPYRSCRPQSSMGTAATMPSNTVNARNTTATMPNTAIMPDAPPLTETMPPAMTTCTEILPSSELLEAGSSIANTKHIEIHEMQMSFLADYQTKMKAMATAAFQATANTTLYPNNLLRPPLEERYVLCCTKYTNYMLNRRNPLIKAACGPPPHNTEADGVPCMRDLGYYASLPGTVKKKRIY
jgi:hypothetical protein